MKNSSNENNTSYWNLYRHRNGIGALRADYLTIDYYTNLRNGDTIKYLRLQCY